MTEVVAHWIGGEPVAEGPLFDKASPADGAVLARVHEAGEALVDRAAAAGRAAMGGSWGAMDLPARAAILERAAAWIEAHADEGAALESADVGRPFAQARAMHVLRSADALRVFAREAMCLTERAWRFRDAEGEALTYTVRRPRGVVAAIAPWNVPLLLLTLKVAPALAMGNAVVAKPSEETPRSALWLARALHEAGLPAGAFNVVQGFGRGSAGEALTRHPGIAAIGFTGEGRTGAAIMRAAADGLREVCLELGGKNAALVFADADLDAAARGVARSAFANTGQVCFCTERVLVERAAMPEFVERLRVAAEALRLGAPDDPEAQLGPLVSRRHREKVSAMVEAACAAGATVITGAKVPSFGDRRDGGAFYPPTVLTGLADTHPFVTDEVFGPVCHVAAFDTEAEAIARANDTRFGLAASIWTQSVARAHRLAERLQAGLVWVNCWQVRDLRTPVAGFAASGVGVQGARESLEFFANAGQITLRI